MKLMVDEKEITSAEWKSEFEFNGKKILDGSVQNIKNEFKENKYKIQLSGVAARSETNVFQVVDERANNLTVKINEGFKSNDVLKYFIDKNINVEAFNEILPSLNEIFIQLVEGTKAATRSFQKVQS